MLCGVLLRTPQKNPLVLDFGYIVKKTFAEKDFGFGTHQNAFGFAF